MKTSGPVLWNNADDYADVSIYVVPGTDEWEFIVTLDKQTGQIYDSDPHYAESLEAPFNETENKPPPEVLAAFMAARPKAVAMLEKLK